MVAFGSVILLIVVAIILLCIDVRDTGEQPTVETRESTPLHHKQHEVGDQLLVALTQATWQNKVSNVLPSGKTATTTKPIEVQVLPSNGEKYSIFAVLPDDTVCVGGPAKRGHCVLEVSINLKKAGQEIYVFRAPYGPSRVYALDQIDNVISALSKWVSEFRLFGERRIDESVFG